MYGMEGEGVHVSFSLLFDFHISLAQLPRKKLSFLLELFEKFSKNLFSAEKFGENLNF